MRGAHLWGWLVLAAVTLVAVAGCPKKVQLPGYFLNPGSNPDYPTSQFIVGVGRSSESASLAEQAGRAEVSRQVASEILVQVRREVQVVDEGDRPRVQRFVEQAIRERTEFEHGELIRTDPNATFYDGDHFWAFVALDRSEADRALATEQEGVEDDLRDLRQRAVSAARNGAPGTYVQPARSFLRQYDRWDALRCQRRAITGGDGGDTDLVDGWASEVVRVGGELQDRIGWVIHVRPDNSDVPEESVAAVEESLGEALSELGLRTVLAPGDPCSENTGDRDLAYGLEALVDVEQGLGHIGYKAVIDVTVSGSECFGSGNDLFRTTLERRAMVGVHTSSKQRALELAQAELSARCGDLDRIQVDACRDDSERVVGAQIAGPVAESCPLP